MNRTSKRISEYPFQPLRRERRRFPQRQTRRGAICHSAQAHHTLAEDEF
jgi:hypothetical protein